MPTEVAAFDWDGTLTTRDCVVPFLTRIAGTAALARRLLAAPGPLTSAVITRDRDRLKELGVAAAFTDRAVVDVDGQGRRYAEYVAQHWLRPDTMARLRWHQAKGHAIVVVSASLSPYLHHVGRHVGVDAVVCTELETRHDRYTGALDGPNCRGDHKVVRLRAWLDAHAPDAVVGWAYGDSRGDDALLASAHVAVRVGRHRVDAVPPSDRTTA
jgi:phosphatidylglycerophosphatase C